MDHEILKRLESRLDKVEKENVDLRDLLDMIIENHSLVADHEMTLSEACERKRKFIL